MFCKDCIEMQLNAIEEDVYGDEKFSCLEKKCNKIL